MTRCVVVCAGRVDFRRICHRGGDGAQRGRSGGLWWSVQCSARAISSRLFLKPGWKAWSGVLVLFDRSKEVFLVYCNWIEVGLSVEGRAESWCRCAS